jgi:hypothetical protein
MSKVYSYKKLPTFNPDYYHSWASDVQSAFAERNWTKYLDIANDAIIDDDDKTKVTEHATTLIQAYAFLNQCIPYEHKTRIRNCTTAAQIWSALNEEYASQTREDELRLEGILLDFKKLPTDSISAHISKFSTLIDAVIAQQPENQKYDDSKKNHYFLRSLETANIPNENWMGFITSLGKTWLTLSTHELYAEAGFPQPQPTNRFSSDKFLRLPQPSPILPISSQFPYPNSSFLNIPPKFKSHMIGCSGLAP